MGSKKNAYQLRRTHANPGFAALGFIDNMGGPRFAQPTPLRFAEWTRRLLRVFEACTRFKSRFKVAPHGEKCCFDLPCG